MAREFYHYSLWEDYLNGMYRNVEKEDTLTLVDAARTLLATPLALEDAMLRVIKEWPIATAQNLTNNEANAKAWLGQAACCIQCHVPEDLTRTAWNTLKPNEMRLANRVADLVIQAYEQLKTQKNGLQKDLFRN